METVGEGVQLVNKTAGLIEDKGMLIVVGALFIIAAAIAIWLVARYWNRKLNGEYIKQSDVIDWIKKNKPEVLKPDISVLPNLRNHRFFNESTRQIRIAEGSSQNIIERDLVVWTLRGYRDVFADIVELAYEDKSGFDEIIGDPTKFRSKIDSASVEASAAIRYRLVDEFGFSSSLYAKWQKSRETSDDLMTNMLEIAAERLSAYDRLQCILDSQYARVLMVRKIISEFVAKEATKDDVELYKPPVEAGDSTFQTMSVKPIQRGSYPAAIFERRKKC